MLRQAQATLSELDRTILIADASSPEARLPAVHHARELGISLVAAQKAQQRAYEHLKRAFEWLALTFDLPAKGKA